MQLRKVIVSKPVRQEMPSNGTRRVVATYPLVPQGEALFHQFGVGYEEFKTCPGNYTTAVVEWPDGRVESVPVEHVRFVTPNDRVEGRDAALSRRVPSHDGLCGAVDTE